ncbi:cytochrome c3 family protein [Chondromyces apiculatus]|uniref:Molybdopterin oxidoreductase subunit chaperone protein HtpG n=1 Tax=Chondromyces apiculatus DSM 436 TaxID=1192034 RepID=A0A017TDA9_9BACT|nr:cytochrome c3 family protein [Chondromyces apiculatus]EYF06912.1 Molybdopterin oxidoreductase subunit chaperone protein HtpG [Chondromyces apiculatus DSM 436]
MAFLFPPWSNTAVRVALASLLLGGASAVAAPMIYIRSDWSSGESEAQVQPVQFDHRHHYQDDAMDCRYCHNTVEESATAGMPSVGKCMGCHGQIWNDSPQLAPVRESYFSGRPIRWRRVHNVPDFVYFNHAIHVNKGVGCVTCHGRVDQMASVRQSAPLTMQWCLDCHRAPEPHLRPLSAITDMTWSPGGGGDEVGRGVAEALNVQHLMHCTTCHR